MMHPTDILVILPSKSIRERGSLGNICPSEKDCTVSRVGARVQTCRRHVVARPARLSICIVWTSQSRLNSSAWVVVSG